MKKNTYTMTVGCPNCHSSFDVEIEKGHSTFGRTEECPYCGKRGCNEFSYKKPDKY